MESDYVEEALGTMSHSGFELAHAPSRIMHDVYEEGEGDSEKEIRGGGQAAIEKSFIGNFLKYRYDYYQETAEWLKTHLEAPHNYGGSGCRESGYGGGKKIKVLKCLPFDHSIRGTS